MGGLVIMIDRNFYTCNLLLRDQYKIFVQITAKNSIFIIGACYYRPQLDVNFVISDLNTALSLMENNYPNMPLIVGGDFNAHIKNHNQLHRDLYISPYISSERNNLDSSDDPRGTALCELMENHSLFVLNGRSPGDSKGGFTFVGAQGKSTVDLVWVDNLAADFVGDFGVLYTDTPSDHFPVRTTLLLPSENPQREVHSTENTLPRLKWSPAHAATYSLSLEYNHKISSPIIDPNTAAINLISAIREAFPSAPPIHPIRTQPRSEKPWYDAECRLSKRELNSLLRRCKSLNFPADLAALYSKRKSDHNALLKNKQKNHQETVVEGMIKAKNSVEFWKYAKNFICKSRNNNNCIPHGTWVTYLTELYACNDSVALHIIPTFNPIFDAPITLGDVCNSLKKCKMNKAPGADGISFEFYQNLPSNWLLYLTNLFNLILQREQIPDSWGEVLIIMLHKKGDPLIPGNYRSIALINTAPKLFTQTLCTRLQSWSENGILGEFQSGFRSKRSCMDNVFSLHALIQIQFSKTPSRKVFALFIDFSKAFDSVNHYLLFNKLSQMGVSSKFLNLIKDLYAKAHIRVRGPNSLSPPINVEKGVLQGEILSPLLFALFLNDLESFLREKGCVGVAADHTQDILLLAYADDIVITVDSPHMLTRVMRHLETYCQNNHLTVNANKTKIMVFRKNPRKLSKFIPKFFLGAKEIEIVKSYEYLGIIFSDSGNFNAAADNAIANARKAMGASQLIVRRMGHFDCKTAEKLLSSLTLSVLLYEAPVWALDKLELVEKVQTSFYKQLLSLPNNTPDYAIRLETNRPPVAYHVLNLILSWASKILSMPNTRYPKILFRKLKELHIRDPNSSPNWFSKVNNIFASCELSQSWVNRDSPFNEAERHSILTNYLNRSVLNDKTSLTNSSSLLLLPSLNLPAAGHSYLSLNLPLNFVKIFAQIRMYNKFNPRIIENDIYKFDPFPYCPCCHIHECETLIHFLCICTIYNDLKLKHFQRIDTNADFYVNFLNSSSTRLIRNFVLYLSEALLFRKKLLQD